MEELIFPPLVIVLGLAVHAVVLRVGPAEDGRLFTLSLLGHLTSAFVQVLLVMYYFPGGGDMLGYYEIGVPISELLRVDFAKLAPEVMRLFLQQPAHVAFPVVGGASSASMAAAASFILFFTGDSLYASALLVAVGAYASKVAMYLALKDYFDAADRRAVAIGVLLLPSAVFWSSALLKEPLTMVAMGPLLLALGWLAAGRRRLLALCLIVPTAIVIAMLKPYVLMTLAITAGVFYLWASANSVRTLLMRPAAVVVAFAIGTSGFVLGARYFAKADSESDASAFAAQRRVGYQAGGGSGYRLEGDDDEVLAESSAAQELALAPLALVTAFFRPFIVEARNAVQFVNALESTMLLYLFVEIMRKRGWAATVARVVGSPALMFCFVFAFALALGTGLASSNLGTLSRYRAPMMPFFFVLLLVLRRVPVAKGPLVLDDGLMR